MSTLRSVRTDLLELHYLDSGPQDGPVAILLHGWPDDAHTWHAVAPQLNAAGWRTLAPFLRGFGPSRFLHDDTLRSAQLTAFASDTLALADALGIEHFAVIGHDWGARTAYVLAAQAAHRLSHAITLSIGYGAAARPSLLQAQQFWYQWFFALPEGEEWLRHDHRALTRHLWQAWSPAWTFDEDEFARTAASFDNPDWQAITLHGYRHRWKRVEGDPRYEALELRQAGLPPIAVPTLLLHGEDDRCIVPASSIDAHTRFTGAYRRISLPGIGHFPQREAPLDVSDHILDWLRQPATTLTSRPKEAAA